MKLSSFFIIATALSLSSLQASINLDMISEKKEEVKEAVKSLKGKKKEIKNKIKKTKAELKEKFAALSESAKLSSEDQEMLLGVIYDLDKRAQKGSIEALNQACYFLGVDYIDSISFVLNEYYEKLLAAAPKSEWQISLCGTYIGDDGIEYDDGIADEQVKDVSFYSLPIHQWEKKVIEKIISSMAEKSLAQLLLDRKEMEKRGDQIHHVHPLRFVGHVMSDTYLKNCMISFKSNVFKWSNFIDGYAERMREEAARDNLLKHIEGFCDFLKIDKNPVYEIASKGNYEELVVYLLQL